MNPLRRLLELLSGPVTPPGFTMTQAQAALRAAWARGHHKVYINPQVMELGGPLTAALEELLTPLGSREKPVHIALIKTGTVCGDPGCVGCLQAQLPRYAVVCLIPDDVTPKAVCLAVRGLKVPRPLLVALKRDLAAGRAGVLSECEDVVNYTRSRVHEILTAAAPNPEAN